MKQLIAKYTHTQSGYEFDKKKAAEHLIVGEAYIVKHVHMGQSHTSIELEGVDSSFNSVLFDFYVDGNPHCIFSDPDYNPYLSLHKN